MNSLSIYFKQLKTNISKSDIENNLGFVIHTARYFCKRHNCMYLFDDIVQAGNLGLIYACKKFDRNRGFKFTTYAIHWIKAYMNNEIGKQNIIRLPYSQVLKEKEYTEVVSIEKETLLLESIPSNENVSYKTFLKLLVESLTKRMKEILKDLEIKVIELKYYKEYSFSEIGNILNSSKQYAHEVERKAMSKLKEDKEIQNLYPLYMELA